MKNLILTLLIGLFLNISVEAQDVYVCNTVVFCNEAGTGCFELEICDIEEPEEDPESDDYRSSFRGVFQQASSSLYLGGFPKKFEGKIIRIKKGTILNPPVKGDPAESLIGRTVESGDYMIKKGRLEINLSR